MGVWQPGRHRGYEVHSQAGAPVWHELHTRDHDGAVAFYQRVFGWHTSVVSDTDELRYTTMTEGEQQYAGIMDARAYLPEGTPSFWEVYFGVEDADASLAAGRAARRARCWSRRWTPRTAGWPRWPTRPARPSRSSLASRLTRSDTGGGRGCLTGAHALRARSRPTRSRGR